MNTFPTLVGLNWDIKKRILFSNNKDEAASGARFITSRWPSNLPHYEFDLVFEYLSQADRDAMEAFYCGQCGDAIPFLLNVTNDNTRTDIACGTGNGVQTVFAIPLPAQTQVVSTTNVKKAGTIQGSGFAVAAASNANTITFTVAPTAGQAITWSGTYAYVVNFSDPMVEFGYLWNGAYEQEGISFRTFR